MLAAYLIKRILMALIVCALVACSLVLVVQLVPGDPATTLAEQQGLRPSPQYVAFVRREMRLDKPVPGQLWDFVRGAVQGDLGRDFQSQLPVTSLIGAVLPDTLILALTGVLLSVLVGVPLGVIVARHPNSILDRGMRGVSVLLISCLPYVFGLVLLLLFAVRLHWFPTRGTGRLDHPLEYAQHLVLPAVSLAIPWWGYLPRLVRASMLEVLNSPYIRTARAFGIKERIVFYQYALKNALVPVVALSGLMLGYALAGTLYAETIFGRAGLGSLALGAVGTRNWPIIRATALLFALFYVGGNLLSDISYRFLDPRIRVEEGAEVPT